MPTDPIRMRPGEEGRLIVHVPYSPDHVAKIKTVVGRRWHQQEKHWTVPRTDRTIAQVLALFPGEPVEVDAALRSVRLLDHQEPPDGSMSHHPVAIWPGLLDQVHQAIRTRHYGKFQDRCRVCLSS